jgi:hypothetical protein
MLDKMRNTAVRGILRPAPRADKNAHSNRTNMWIISVCNAQSVVNSDNAAHNVIILHRNIYVKRVFRPVQPFIADRQTYLLAPLNYRQKTPKYTKHAIQKKLMYKKNDV